MRLTWILAFVPLPLAQGDEQTLDWLLKEHATTAPATAPSTQASMPLVRTDRAEPLHATLTLSHGETITGEISTTPGKPLRVWVESEHRYVDVAMEQVAEIRATVVWERDEKQWHFIASGSDLKEYTGKTYPARELAFTFTLHDGTAVTGGTVAPLYIKREGEPRLYVLNKRQKGEVDQTLAELVYVQRVRFHRSK